ncbi:MAG: AAA family ATPase [Succinivibrio sp.]|nr:AAA family ATPase [Succinivibrio sp.]
MPQILKSIATGDMDFAAHIEGGHYYVDKTAQIRQVLEDPKKTLLFTRPRRFGKTMMLSTLKHFLSMDLKGVEGYEARQRGLFAGLSIAADQEFCQKHLGQYPVIFVSFNGVGGDNFTRGLNRLCSKVRELYAEFEHLLSCPKLSNLDKELFWRIARVGLDRAEADERVELVSLSLSHLATVIYKYSGRDAVVLIDEYDVPLLKAHLGGYYQNMVDPVRGMLSAVIKPEESAHVARCIVTGCLRASKESIFTGANNAVVYGISDLRHARLFGFTEEEVDAVLSYYGLEKQRETVKLWYDGYRIAARERVYCPWDVMSYCDAAAFGQKTKPQLFWSHTSGNDIIYEFVDYADEHSLDLMQRLLDGETVTLELDEYMAIGELEAQHSTEQLFTMLYVSGYLTATAIQTAAEFSGITDPLDGNPRFYTLKIPNREILELFSLCIKEFFRRGKPQNLLGEARDLVSCLLAGQSGDTQYLINKLLLHNLSVRSLGHETSYQNFIYGVLLVAVDGRCQRLRTEEESGDGYLDLSLTDSLADAAVVIEFKKAREGEDLESLARSALGQIKDKRYGVSFRRFKRLYAYGVACRGKNCQVLMEDITAA